METGLQKILQKQKFIFEEISYTDHQYQEKKIQTYISFRSYTLEGVKNQTWKNTLINIPRDQNVRIDYTIYADNQILTDLQEITKDQLHVLLHLKRTIQAAFKKPQEQETKKISIVCPKKEDDFKRLKDLLQNLEKIGQIKIENFTMLVSIYTLSKKYKRSRN